MLDRRITAAAVGATGFLLIASARAEGTAPPSSAVAVPADTAPAPAEGAAPPAAGPPAASPPAPYYAEPAQPVDTTPIRVAQPPLPPLTPRSRHYHDGFYFRFSVGYGALWTGTEVDKSNASASFSGSGLALDVLAGGTPMPGLVIGGGALFQDAFKPSRDVSLRGSNIVGLADGASTSLGYAMIGPMIDAFPNPSDGFHVGGLLGPAWLGLKDKDGSISRGLGLTAWVGYMWWASSQTSVGGLLRLSLAWTGRKVAEDGSPTAYDVVDMTRSLGLVFSVLYH
jgi:hypothetical protein